MTGLEKGLVTDEISRRIGSDHSPTSSPPTAWKLVSSEIVLLLMMMLHLPSLAVSPLHDT